MYAQPKVYLTAQIKPVTEKDYNLFLQFSQNGYGGGLGSYYSSGNNYHSIDGIDIFLDGMTDEKVCNFFGDYKIEISWVDLLNREHKEYYYLKDYYK